MLDHRTAAHDDPHPVTGEYIWTPHNNRFGWAALLGHEPGEEKVSLYASPARAASLAGLPPTFVSTGALDLFLEEDLEYARRLIRDGVPCELHVYPGAFHGFDMAPFEGVADSSLTGFRWQCRIADVARIIAFAAARPDPGGARSSPTSKRRQVATVFAPAFPGADWIDPEFEGETGRPHGERDPVTTTGP